MDGRVLVGIGDSGPAPVALAWATQRGRRGGQPLLLLHVGSESPPIADLSADILRVPGPLTNALAEVVRPTDVLVIGTGKTGFIYGRVFGVKSLQIATAVQGNVAVIPDVDLRFRSGVVAGIDREETAVLVAQTAAAEAIERGEELHLIQSVPHAGLDGDTKAIALAEHVAQAEWPGLVIRSMVTTRSAAQALLDASRNAALIVLGPGSGAQPPPAIGSVTHDVLININAPVLIARHRS